jgi:predicted outer membrane repeat protein
MEKALEMAKMGVVKTITVIGAIGGFSADSLGNDEILITGKPDASQAEKAKINGEVNVERSNISFAYITIENQGGDGIYSGYYSKITLGQDAVVQNCERGVGYGPELLLTHNAMITGCTEDGVNTSSASVTMTDDSSITNCGGYGIRAGSRGVLLSGNAKISGNKRGGVRDGGRGYGGTLTLSDNAEISNNTNTDDYSEAGGGGVRVVKLVMNGGRIINNTAKSNGGGVYIEDEMEMNGGLISNNTATGQGGGVYVGSRVETLKITGGEISGNRAERGGGVYAYRSTSVSGGTISGNKAEYGAGVYVRTYSSFTLTGGSISGNEAEFVGGGVYVESDSKYTATGGTVENNTAGDGVGNDVFNQ